MSPTAGEKLAIRIAVQKAHERRLRSPQVPKTNAYRILNGPADSAPAGLTLDRYGAWLVLAARKHLDDRLVERWAEGAAEVLDLEGIVVKRLAERPRDSSSHVIGERSPPLVQVEEGDALFEVHPDDGVQTGLFLDQRETRWRARDFAAGREVLNLFSYTCAFSVHAGLAGATRVTSVDVSHRSLSWGRRNMALSGLDPNQHRWFTDDVPSHLRRPRGSYGLVILDPPVFGHGRRPFSLEKDLIPLLAGALGQLEAHGVLIFSTHHTSLTDRVLDDACREASISAGHAIELVERRGLPDWDHPTAPSHAPGDRGDYLRTLILRRC